MAESYRGLTIRIGGDTTKLTQALRAANGAISGTQQEIRKLGQALRLDPSNIQAYNLQMGYMANQATNTAMKLHQLQEAASKVANETVKLSNNRQSATIAEMAEQTENVHLRAEQAKAAYNKVNDSLAEMYRTLSAYNEKAAETFNETVGKKLADGLAINSTKETFDKFAENLSKAFDSFGDSIQRPKQEITEVVEQMKALHQQYLDTKSDNKKLRLQEQFESLLETITKVNGTKVNFDEGKTDIRDIDKVLESLEKIESLKLDPEALTNFRAEVKHLKDEYTVAMDELRQANAVAEFADLNVEVVKAQASVKNLAKALTDMKGPSDLMRTLNEAVERTKELSEAYKGASNSAKSMESAYSVNSDNTDAQVAAMKSWATAEQVAAEKAQELRTQVDAFDRSKIDEYADASKSAQQQLMEAALAHAKAATNVAVYEGAIEATRNKLEQLGLDASEVAKILERVGTGVEGRNAAARHDEENDKERVEAVKQLADYEELLAEAERQEAQAAEQLEYSKQRKELEGLDTELLKTIGDMDAARVAMQRLAAGEVKPHIDATGLDRLREQQKELSDYGSSMGKAFKDAASDISALTPIIDSASERAQALSDTFVKNPGNTDALELSISALDEALIGCGIQAEQLRAIIDGYDSEKIDKAAIATSTVGINAERAAQNVSEVFKQLEKAQSDGDRLAKEYVDALNDAAGSEGGATNPRIAALKEDLDAAVAEFQRLQDVAAQALSQMDAANATRELVGYREQLAQIEQKYLSIADKSAEMAKSEAVSSVFGDTSNIDSLGTALDAAVAKAKAFDAAIKVDPKNLDLAKQRTAAFSEVAAIAKTRTEAIRVAMSNIDSDRVEALRQKFGSIPTAVKATTDAVKAYSTALQTASEMLDGLLDDAGLSDMREQILEDADAFDGRLTPEILECVEAVRALTSASDGAFEDMNFAAVAQKFEDLQGTLADTMSKASIKPNVDEAAFQQAISRVGELAKQVGREIVESSNTIDAAYRDMRKTVNGTEEDFKRLHDAAVEFSQTHITSADTMLEMEALGGQLGIAASALQEFGEVSSNLDIATDIPAEEIALKLGQITNIMSDLDDTTFTNFADSLVRLGNNTATTESAIMDVAQRMASVANVTSMTTPELLAWSAAIASTGQRSESAATAINNTITGIGAAVAEGGDTLKGFAQIANMTSEDFEKAWRDNSSDALEAFVKGLEGLTDDSTTAIAALESVGISGVRQRTALLSLSQTIDNLDKSMDLSTDAFNNGGDAAREAAQKSEGFSGSLGILQNNVAALTASLGDSMIPFMNALSSVLNAVTDGINMLPAPLRSAVVEMGALVAAGGMVMATLKGLGFDAAIAGITGFISSIMSAGSAMEAFQLIGTTAFKAVGAAANALPAVAAITAVITAINMAGEYISRAVEDSKLLKSATDDLVQSVDKLGESYSAVSNRSQTLEEMREETNSTLQTVADFGDRMEETWAKVGNDSAMAEAYAGVMEELSSKSSLTAGEISELVNAVDQYNRITGSSISITNDNTGALSLNADGIREVTEAYREQAEAQAYMDLYNDALKQQVENNENLKRAKEELAEAEATWGLRIGEYGFLLGEEMDKYRELQRRIESYSQVVESNEKVLADYKEHINGTASEFKNMDAALTSTGLEFEKFSGLSDEQKKRLYEIEQALKAAGDTLANYGSLTSSQLAQLVAMWNGNVGDIVAAINRMKAATEDAGSYGAPSEEQTAAFKKQLDDQYENLKATRDAEYKAAQRSFEQTRTARQHELDAEYKEAQRQSQSYLKEYKRAQQEEVDAFKDATDAKVREIDREYKAKERLLEQEESAAEKAIDAKIKALEAEQRAEDKEQESLERKHKAEEYEYKIASAKTTQKRKEAEEEYSIWKKKNQHDDAKDARKLQIDDLKEQKSDLKKQLSERKKELQDSHTEAVKDYKTEREQMLRVLQDSLDRQYEMEQQNEERRLEAIKAAHTAELDSMKYASDIALENMKARHTAELDDLKDTNALKLVEYKKHGEEVADAVKEAADAAGKSANEASDSVSTASDTVTEKMGLTLAQFSGVVTEVPGNVAQAVDVGNHTLQERLNAAVMPTTDATQKIRNAALNGLQGLPDEMGNTATSGGVSLVSHLGEYVPEAQSTADDIRKGILGPLEQAGTDAGEYGRGVTVNFGNGVAKDSSHATDNAAAVAEATGKQLGSVEGVSATWGSHAIINFANGMTSGNASSALNGALKWVADLVTAFLGHSTPDRGPLAHDDEWGGHLVDNLVTSMGAKEGELTRGVSRIADTMQEGLQGVRWEYDPAAAMVEAMREHENEVLDQAKRLSEMVERGFDPKLTMTAAYEAIDKIDAAEAKRRQPTQNVSSVTNAPVINITIPGVVVREEADVDLLSRKIADKVRREVAARLG